LVPVLVAPTVCSWCARPTPAHLLPGAWRCAPTWPRIPY